MSFRKITALILTLALGLVSSPVFADVPYLTTNGTLSGGSPYLYLTGLSGQGSCTISSSGAGTIALEVSQDNITWTAATVYTPQGASSTALTAPGSVTGGVASYIYTRAHLTSGAGGSTYFACGAQIPVVTGSGGGGGGNVTVTNFPNPQNVNVTQFGSAVVGAATAAGTSATGNIVGVQGVTGGVPIATSVTFPSTIAVTQSTSPWVSSVPAGLNVNNFPALQAVSGTVTANAGTGFPSVTAAGTSGASLTTIQGSVSGVPVPISGTITTTPSGVQNVNQLQMGGATLGAASAIGTTASGNVQGVQGTTGGVPLPVSGSVSVSNFPATQPVSGTVTANAGTGTFTVAGTVTANAGTGFPSVTAAGTSGASLTTIQGSPTGVAVPISGTVTTTPSGTQNVQGLGTTGTPTGGVLTTQTQDVSNTGSIAVGTIGNNFQETLGAGQSTVGVLIGGTFASTTLAFEGSVDGTTFSTITCYQPSSSTVSSTVTTAGTSQCNVGGFLKFGVFVTATGTGGPVSVTFQNTSSGGIVSLGSSIPGGTANIGTTTSSVTGSSDAESSSSKQGQYILGFNGTSWDRIRTSTVGTSIASGSVGILGVQGVSGGVTVGVNGTGTAGTPNAGVVTIQGILNGTSVPVTTTPQIATRTLLTSASATACTSLEVASTNSAVIGLTSAANVGQTVTLDLYDEGTSPTCAAADHIFSIQMGPSQIITFANGGMGLTNGLAYTLSGSLTSGNNITIQRR